MVQILIVEDDKNTAKLMKTILDNDGYITLSAQNGLKAFEILENQQVDLILLDVMMPVMDGYTFTEELRAVNDYTPILMVTAKSLPEEKCKGFIVGTDDYMVKPVNEQELLLRIKALLRRAKIANENKLIIGKVVLDYDSFSVTRDGLSQTLPQKEFQLLYKLLSYPGKIFTRLQLMDEIWGMNSDTTDTTLNVHVARLRKRFEGWPEFDIKAIRGIGYKAVVANEE